MAASITIKKDPVLEGSSNYELLRKAGYAYIEELGSALWTDYNVHDPGITILEALCYALTDLGNRTSLPVKDLLALPTQEVADADGQFADDKRQALYTAANILTVNPVSIADFRKLLINIDGVKNGWLQVKQCACDDINLFANCKKSVLQYAPTDHKIIVRGLYDVLLEFDEEEKSGNLNSGKIRYNFSFPTAAGSAKATVELRLPSWAALEKKGGSYKNFRGDNAAITAVLLPFISGNKPVLADIPSSPEIVLDNALRKPVFTNIEVTYQPDKNLPVTETIIFKNVAINVWFRSTAERRELKLEYLKKALQDITSAGIMPRYLQKIKTADKVVASAVEQLHSHRNLAEDYCSIKAIEVEDIGICADMQVEADADMEAVLAEVYYRLDEYMSPTLKFYSLQQLLAAGKTVDEIFDGPRLTNGFIKDEELAAAALRQVLYASDAINLIMDIPGVKSISNFVFTRFDDDGKLIESQPWSMNVSYNRQARLYLLASKVMLFKNGLPFLADANELSDTLQVIKGQRAQPQYTQLQNDLPVPHGNYVEVEEYYAVQNSFPQTYGIGKAGLSQNASDERKAQAKQLKAYLLFFEQILVNYLSQIANVKELFAADNNVKSTYFSGLLKTEEIEGLTELYNVTDDKVLKELVENEDVFLDRRNRFLDHMLGRFAESFADYALMLYTYTGNKKIADSTLIENKVSFIRQYPMLSSNRGKAFNYKDVAAVCDDKNMAGLVKRIRLLLGYGKSYFNYLEVYEVNEGSETNCEFRWRLKDDAGAILLTSAKRYSHAIKEKASGKAKADGEAAFPFMASAGNYKIKEVTKFVLSLVNDEDEILASAVNTFITEEEAKMTRDTITGFIEGLNAAEKIFLVEHLLFRPRNIPSATFTTGDPLLTVCLDDNCSDCDERDPYSFRITLVLNGESGFANDTIDFRRFAEQTIRREAPAHLGIKICWVSAADLASFEKVYCSWLTELAKLSPDAEALHNKLIALLAIFQNLNSVYPPATLHDCIDGNDDNRVFLGHTAIISDEELKKRTDKKKLDKEKENEK